MTDINFISTYKSIIRTCRDSSKTESLQIVINQLYNLSQLTALQSENTKFQMTFQKLALLCKKFLKKGKNLENIEDFLENFKVPKEIINLRTGFRFVLDLNNWIMAEELMGHSQGLSFGFVYNQNNQIVLYEYSAHPHMFSVEVRRDPVHVQDEFLIEDSVLKVLDIGNNCLVVQIFNQVQNLDYRTSKRMKNTKFCFELVNGICFFQIEEGRVFKKIKELFEAENKEYRRGLAESYFRAGNEIFLIV
jgi:hypothetical protein